MAGLRNRQGRGVYNIPVENHGGGWERTDFPDQDEDQELRDAQTQVQVISSLSHFQNRMDAAAFRSPETILTVSMVISSALIVVASKRAH
jgi:hypothetical protein